MSISGYKLIAKTDIRPTQAKATENTANAKTAQATGSAKFSTTSATNISNIADANPKKLISDFVNFNAWKADRAALFDKYKSAGETVLTPQRSSTTAKAAQVSNTPEAMEANRQRNEANPNTGIIQTVAGPLNTRELVNARLEQGRQIRANNRVEAPQNESSPYGNYFVFKMEKYIGEIVRSQESIATNQNSINFHQLSGSTDKGADEFIQNAQSEIEYREQRIKNTVNGLRSWAEKNGVLEETNTFFQEFTRDYYGHEQKLSLLIQQYNS